MASRSFNLVIERLLISGVAYLSVGNPTVAVFQSRYRAASHFRDGDIDGADADACGCAVSISLSSGFSFQGEYGLAQSLLIPGFNLVIERLLISGIQRLPIRGVAVRCFNLVIERLLISGLTC